MAPSFFLPDKQERDIQLSNYSSFSSGPFFHSRLSTTMINANVSLLHAFSQVSSFFRPSPSFSGVAELPAGEGESGGGFRGGTTGVFLSRLSPAFLVVHGRRGERTRARFCGVAHQRAREQREERGEGVRKVSLKLLQSLGSACSLSRSR